MESLRQPPRQQRSRARVELILDAAERTFGELGYGRTTTNHIADAAGISVGSLYRWFPDKEAIARQLVDRYLDELSAQADRAFVDHHEEPTPLLVRSVVRAIAAVWLGRPALSVLAAASIGPHPADVPSGRLHDLLVERASGLLVLRVPGLPTDERGRVARTCIGLLVGALLETAGEESEGWDLVDEAAYAIAAYLAMKYPFETSHRWLEPMEGLPPSRPSVQ